MGLTGFILPSPLRANIFLHFVLSVQIIAVYLQVTQLAFVGLVGHNIDGMDVFSRCRARLRKGVYGRYCSVTSNFATLNPNTEVMQRNVCVGGLYPDSYYTNNV